VQAKLINSSPEQTYALIFSTGDEVLKQLTQFAAEKQLLGAHFTAIGAFQRVTLGYFELDKQEYKKIPVDEQVEVLSLIGNIVAYQGKPKIHAHVVVGRSDGSTRGGHLVDAVVRPTLEVILTESPQHLRRKMDKEAGIPLINLQG
jgi:predicted DNA-binding protein with PD1-like motif